MTFTIYGLIDPETRLVRYVGKALDLRSRYGQHCSGKDRSTAKWVVSLSAPPILVILETGREQRVPRKQPGLSRRVALSTVAETKWIKRFRRTVLNHKQRDNSASTWDWLTNPDEAGRSEGR